MEKRKFIGLRDGAVVLALLFLAGGIWLLLRAAPQGARVVIERGGQVVLSRELSTLAGPEEVEIEDVKGNPFVVSIGPEGVQVIQAGCHDQVCVRTGKLTRAGESAICIPGQVAVRLEGGQRSVNADAFTG